MAQIPPKEVIDARYRAKLEARATGKAPVMVDVPKDSAGVDLDARAREKLSRHQRGQSAAQADAPKPEAPESAPTKAEPQVTQSDERRDGGHRHEQRNKHR